MAGSRVLGYVRVSTAEQAASGLGLDAQQSAIERECAHREWQLLRIARDEGESGSSLERPGLREALEQLAAGGADALIVAKLDRLTRSVVDFGLILEWATEANIGLVALDFNLDTSSPGGRLVANVLIAVAEWERETIAARTRDSLAALRAQGKRTGRPAVADRPELVDRIVAMRETMTLQAIADTLNAEGIPTMRGGAEWRVSSVQSAAGYRRRKPRRRRSELPEIARRR